MLYIQAMSAAVEAGIEGSMPIGFHFQTMSGMLTLSQSNHLSNKITMSSENKLQKMSF
jgi:hypothetical protein